MTRPGHHDAVPHPLTAWEHATTEDASPVGTPYSTIRCLGNIATLAASVIALPLRTRTGQPHACSYTAKNVIPIQGRKRARYGTGITVSERSVGRVLRIEICFRACIEARYSPLDIVYILHRWFSSIDSRACIYSSVWVSMLYMSPPSARMSRVNFVLQDEEYRMHTQGKGDARCI